MQTLLTQLIGIKHPIIQAGMSWASSSAALPGAVSNAGGLGVLAAGPLYVEDLERELLAMKQATPNPFGLNIPLYSPKSKEFLSLALKHRVPVVIASQGGPKAHLQAFKDQGILWFHVVASLEHALKAQDAGVDAVVVVGAEAGGHPPGNDVSTLINVRHVLKHLSIPVIAGGGVETKEPVESVSEAIGGDGGAIDADALGGFGQVRGSEEAGAEAGSAEGRFDHGAGGAFAIGSGDMHEAEPVLRAAQGLEHGADALQAQFGGLDLVAERIEELDGIGVVHATKNFSAVEM